LYFSNALRDYFGNSIASHRHAIERISNLHRSLLVSDDDQLRIRTEFCEDAKESAEVGVI
jgi:hypothetical protein